MHTSLFERLHAEGLISDTSLENVRAENSLLSVHWELRTILYLGVLLLAGGLGILVYKNIDSIGHQVVLAFILLLSAGCFLYCKRKKLPFSTAKVPSPNAYFDYVLLLGCLTFITFITYLQVQYNAFGNAYGLATFIPMVVLFFSAYFFDHLGVLSMAIANLAAWAGIAVTPLKILRSNQFSDTRIILTGVALGALLTFIAWASADRKIKAHFCFTYLNFGMNILFVSILAGMFYFDSTYLLWFLLLGAAAVYFYRRAVKIASFYFVMMIALYMYIGVTYVLLQLISPYLHDAFGLWLLYFIGTAVGTIVFLVHMNKKLKNDTGV